MCADQVVEDEERGVVREVVLDEVAPPEIRRRCGFTRARDELYLTYPHMRLSGGYGDIFQRPSRFLKEIPNELVEDWQVRKG